MGPISSSLFIKYFLTNLGSGSICSTDTAPDWFFGCRCSSSCSLVLHCLLDFGKSSLQHLHLFHQLVILLTQLFDILIGCLQILAQLLFSFARLLFVLNQLLIVLNQLFFLLDHLGYFIKLERWKLAVLLQELKQVVSNLDAMMCFLLDLVLIFKGVSEMEVKGTVFQFETKA